MGVAGQCWQTSQPLNKKHNMILKSMFPAGIERIFIDLADIPQSNNNVDDNYVETVMNYMPDGMRYWQNDEGEDHHLLGVMGQGSTVNHLLMCKNINAIPLLCLGHSEERQSWLSRNPINHVTFLEQFCKGLAHYLRNKMGFTQAHLEIFNEPKKCIPISNYITICKHMSRGFKQYLNFKVHVGSNDIEQDLAGYIQEIVKDKELLKTIDYYATHVLWERQHDQGYIATVNNILKSTNLKQSVTEFSPDGDWDTFNELIENNIEIYCILFVLRRDFFGDVFDDIYVFTREDRPNLGLKSGDIISFNQAKFNMLVAFNNKYYNKQLPIEKEGIKLEKIYKNGSRSIGVTFIQKVLNSDLDIDINPKLKVDGWFGAKTEAAVKLFQKHFNITQTGIVDEKTFKVMIFNEPNLFDELIYDIAVSK